MGVRVSRSVWVYAWVSVWGNKHPHMRECVGANTHMCGSVHENWQQNDKKTIISVANCDDGDKFTWPCLWLVDGRYQFSFCSKHNAYFQNHKSYWHCINWEQSHRLMEMESRSSVQLTDDDKSRLSGISFNANKQTDMLWFRLPAVSEQQTPVYCCKSRTFFWRNT